MRQLDSLVFAPMVESGAARSLYSVCEWLSSIGRSSIAVLGQQPLVSWFEHDCRLYDLTYMPDVLVYPDEIQPHLGPVKRHICVAQGERVPIRPHADLVVCQSPAALSSVKQRHPKLPAMLIPPSINRSMFEYDGRPKKDRICYVAGRDERADAARLLRERYGDGMLTNIAGLSEARAAEALKDARVFVWCGVDEEGPPRPPREALVAGCVVVGLGADLNEGRMTDFGIRCSTIAEVVDTVGEALTMPVPTQEERAVVRDGKEEMRDWLALMQTLDD